MTELPALDSPGARNSFPEGRVPPWVPDPPSIGKALRNFRVNGLFCDVALHFSSRGWSAGQPVGEPGDPPPPPLFAHKVVLAACSPYFFETLTSLSADVNGTHHVFLPADVCEDSLQFVLSWMYGEDEELDQKPLTTDLATAVATTSAVLSVNELVDFFAFRWLPESLRESISSTPNHAVDFAPLVEGQDSLSESTPANPVTIVGEELIVSVEPVVKTEAFDEWTEDAFRFDSPHRMSLMRKTCEFELMGLDRASKPVNIGKRGRPKVRGKKKRYREIDEGVRKRPRGETRDAKDSPTKSPAVNRLSREFKLTRGVDPFLDPCVSGDQFVCAEPGCAYVLSKSDFAAQYRGKPARTFRRHCAKHLLRAHQILCPTMYHRCLDIHCNYVSVRKRDVADHVNSQHHEMMVQFDVSGRITCGDCGDTVSPASMTDHIRMHSMIRVEDSELRSSGEGKENGNSGNQEIQNGGTEDTDDDLCDDDDDEDEELDCLGRANAFCKLSQDPVLKPCLFLDVSNPLDPYGKFVCPRCDFVLVKKDFKTRAQSFNMVFYRHAARHLLDHHQMACPTIAYPCDAFGCRHIFLRKADLQVHRKKLHEGVKAMVNCDQCGKVLNSASLSYHMKNVHGSKSFQEKESRLCGICGKRFKNSVLLKIHEKDAHWIGVDPSRVFRCDFGDCDFKTPWKSRFTVHMYMKHKKLLEGAVLYECDICHAYKAPTREQVNKHKKFQHILVKSLPCPQCNMLFKRKCHMEAHFKRVHSEDKPIYVCPECSHEFATSGALKEHRLREHPTDGGVKGRKRFRCPYCPHESFLAGNCMKHVRRIHPSYEAKYIDMRSEAERTRSQNAIYAIYADEIGDLESMDAQDLSTRTVATVDPALVTFPI